MADSVATTPESAAVPAPAGFKAWLPLIVTLVSMPLLAYGTMTFLVFPRMSAPAGQAAEGAEGEGGHGEVAAGHGEAAESKGHGSASGKGMQTAQIDNVIANPAGTMGTRIMTALITLEGQGSGFAKLIEQNEFKLKSSANELFSSKTIAELQAPGRAQLKMELISVFNSQLGSPVVVNVYLEEFAIQ